VTTCCFGEKWHTCLSASVRQHGPVKFTKQLEVTVP